MSTDSSATSARRLIRDGRQVDAAMSKAPWKRNDHDSIIVFSREDSHGIVWLRNNLCLLLDSYEAALAETDRLQAQLKSARRCDRCGTLHKTDHEYGDGLCSECETAIKEAP